MAQNYNINIIDECDAHSLLQGLKERKNELEELIKTLERMYGLKYREGVARHNI